VPVVISPAVKRRFHDKGILGSRWNDSVVLRTGRCGGMSRAANESRSTGRTVFCLIDTKMLSKG
jgi:hypothetical protein